MERALDLGVNYIDTSSIYGGPQRWSERYVGEVMRRRRGEAFLASKTKERTRDGSLRMLEESLKLLQTDHLDLWQLHDIGIAEDIEAVFAKGGAMKALRQAHEQKIVRHLDITGHYRPEAIRRFPFDTILMTLSAANARGNALRAFVAGEYGDRGLRFHRAAGRKRAARARIHAIERSSDEHAFGASRTGLETGDVFQICSPWLSLICEFAG